MIWLERPMAVRRCIWDDGGFDQPNPQRGQGCGGFTVIFGHMESVATKRKAHGKAGHL